jgi:molybdate transport repressor ModE-like protein
MSDGRKITDRQIDVLTAVHRCGSINAAAAEIGISAPVAYRHIKEMENIAGRRVLHVSPRGSKLTGYGTDLLRSMATADERLSQDRRFTVACSPVTEELLMSSLSSTGTDADLLISDDDMNMRLLRRDDVDMIILDDPVHVFDDDSLQWQEIAQMNMVHVDKGTSYIRYRYGAQRIAFRHLDSVGKKYVTDGETLSLTDLLGSGKSFFVDEILLMRKNIRISSSTDPALLRHSILAVYRERSEEIDRLVNELLKRR